MVMRQTPGISTQTLLSPAQPRAVQMIQQSQPVVVRQPLMPVAPVTSLAHGVSFTPSSLVMSTHFAPGLSALGVSTASLMTVQGQRILYSQSPGLNALTSHTLRPQQVVTAVSQSLNQQHMPPHPLLLKPQPPTVQPQPPTVQPHPVTVQLRAVTIQPQSATLQPQAANMATVHQQASSVTNLSQLSGIAQPQNWSAAASPAGYMSYLGTLNVGHDRFISPNTLLEEKARQQILSLIQGAMSVANKTGQVTLANVVNTGAATSQPVTGAQARVIRVVLDKSLSGEGMTARIASGDITPLVRVVQCPSAAIPPPQATAPCSTQNVLNTAKPRTFTGYTSAHAVSTVTSQGCFTSQMMSQKRPASSPVPIEVAPPAKRTYVLDRNGLMPNSQYSEPVTLPGWQKTLPSIQPGDRPPYNPIQTHLSRATVALPTGTSRSTHTSTVVFGTRCLLKQKLAGRRKMTMQVRQDSGQGNAGGAAVEKKAATQGRPRGRPRANHKVVKGGPLSHPIVHLSHQAGAVLPQAEIEEEIEATPLRQTQALPPLQQTHASHGAWPKDQPRLAFEITSDDGFSCRANSMEDAWRTVTDKVQDARSASRLKHMSYEALNGVQMFGVGHDSVVYLVEQLAGARHCRQYNFKYQEYEPQEEEELCINPSGCARCTPFTTRKPYDMFSFLMSRHRHRPVKVNEKTKEEEMEHKSARRATSMELPMAMRFRKLQEHAKEAVGVYRSKIHGRGLFCKRNIDNGEMVIEYSGEIIRSLLTDNREKYYEGKGIGCYMFRIDDCEVVDATMHGSAARFINHSCEPNCYSKVISVDGKKHIVIFANRAIKKGEELTYDYKFPIEDVKIPCSCGSRRCRKYLN